MKKYLFYITIESVLLIYICFVGLRCGGVIGERSSFGDNIGNSIVSQYTEDNYLPIYVSTANQSITLIMPTYEQMKAFLSNDLTNEKKYVKDVFECLHFATVLDNNAKATGWQCGFVLIGYVQGNHAVVAFNTSDMGIIFVEPQTDGIIDIAVGGTYQDQIIVEILIVW